MEQLEYRHARARLEDVVPRSAPFKIYLDPCGACNFKCNFCPCNNSAFQAQERHKIMEWELFEKILEDLKAFQGQVKVINLYGHGEPLLNPRIADMVRELKASHCCRDVRIVTNASLLNEEKSRALIDAGVDLVRVSVEALSTEGYKELCGTDTDFSLIVHNMETFYRLSRGTGSKISAKIISATLKSKGDENRFYDIFTPITDSHFIENVDPIWVGFDEMQFPTGNIDANSVCYQLGERRQICSDPFTDMFIHANGIVSACCADWKFATQYGDVKTEHLAEIWNGEKHTIFQCIHLNGNLEDTASFCARCLRKASDIVENPGQIMRNIEKFRKGEN